MELGDARKIAQYVVPRMLVELPQDIKARLVRPGENEDGLLFRLIEKVASDILFKSNQQREQYL
jgi:hypothetical protein